MALSIGFSGGLFGYEDYKKGDAAVFAASDPDKVKKPGHKSSPEDCETCARRKYQDGSDENVSFKAASHISPEEAPSAVRGHEQEHVSNAYKKAAEKGGKVIHAGVSIHTAVCPECGRTYVSGGVTDTVIKYPKDKGDDDSIDSVNKTGGSKNAENKGEGTPGRNGALEDFNI